MSDDHVAPPPHLAGFDALVDRLEYIHSEHKQARSEQSTINVLIDKRVSRLEFVGEQTSERLNGGAAAFAKLEAQIEKVNAKIDWPWWKVLATVAPAILLIFTWVWQLSRYPDDTKFEALKLQVQELKLQQVRSEGTLGAIQATQDAAIKKLDAIILRSQIQGVP